MREKDNIGLHRNADKPPRPVKPVVRFQEKPAAVTDRSPQFSELNRIEEELLVAKLKAARASILHAGEKGRALEHEVRALLRSILPAEYGLSIGFVVYHTDKGPRLSSQLDVIIYDAIRSGPVISLETCDVFPLEAIYGYVEVKATLQSSSDEAKEPTDNSIEKCLLKNRDLRAMTDRRFWTPMVGSSVKAGLIKQEWMSVRSYVFAFEPVGNIANDLGELAQRMANISKRQGPPTHLHGVFIANHGYLYTRPVEAHKAAPEDYYHIGFTRDHALLAFKTQLLQGLARYPRPPEQWSPAIEQYFQQEPTWTFRQPKI